jgi:hypothetical protein
MSCTDPCTSLRIESDAALFANCPFGRSSKIPTLESVRRMRYSTSAFAFASLARSSADRGPPASLSAIFSFAATYRAAEEM